MAARIKPSKREKKRYLVFEFASDKSLEYREAKKAIIDAILRYLGEFGFEKTELHVIKNLYHDNKGMLKVTNKSLEDLKKALSMIKEINGKEVKFKSLGVSGILKKAKHKFLIHEDKKSS